MLWSPLPQPGLPPTPSVVSVLESVREHPSSHVVSQSAAGTAESGKLEFSNKTGTNY